MSPDEAMAMVGKDVDVVARTWQGDEQGRGRVISYSVVPVVTIERADGSRFSWRHDMVKAATEDAAQ